VVASLLAVAGVSSLIGGLLSFTKPVEKPVKVMLFVGYFWLSAFLQLLLLAGVYYAWRHF
jgi:uncharacterized membrane protein HdeD (DUF308 family)